MRQDLLNIASSALLYDIGKLYSRSIANPDFSKNYTVEFLDKYLSNVELLSSIISGKVQKDLYLNQIEEAKVISSAIDNLPEKDEEKNVTELLKSIIGEIDFGKTKKESKFNICSLSELDYPSIDNTIILDDANQIYRELISKFTSAICSDSKFKGKMNKYMYDRLYSLLNEYAIAVPASTYIENDTYVSLFDHAKLTSAIASCLLLSENENKPFQMLEFDVSGIQRFIFKITEGSKTKKEIAKSLRGRSFFISVITDVITYSYLYEFGLTQSNIIFNTGGGALLLLPNQHDFEYKISNVSKKLSNLFYEMFGTDISYVYATIECDKEELKLFRLNKAIELKEKIDREKSCKYKNILNDTFFFEKAEKNKVCDLCGSNMTNNVDGICSSCKMIKKVSEFFVLHKNMQVIFDFNHRLNFKDSVFISFGDLTIHFIDSKYDVTEYDYIETYNEAKLGRIRVLASMVPMKHGRILSFEEIAEKLVDDDYGDKKLGVLKMDVDNLGAVFAFGLSKTRSLSKFLTLSRLMEQFFSKNLMNICKNTSMKINPNIGAITDNATMFYINYAGGDDLVIIGPAAGIIELANDIHVYFDKFTNNENLSISGGIHIQKPVEPIRFGIKMAEDNLSASKSISTKNSITLLNTSCSFAEYDSIINKAKYYKELIDSEMISRTNLYSYMKILSEVDEKRYIRIVPNLFYSLKRNISDNKVREGFVKDFSTADNLDKIVLEMKLAIMQTRG